MTKAKCTICGNEYDYCPRCEKRNAQPNHWKYYTDTMEHFQIHVALSDYQAGAIDKSDMKKTLEYLGVTKDMANEYIPSVKKVILDVLGEDTKNTNKKSKP